MKHIITGLLSHQEDISSNRYREHQVEITVCIMGSPSQFQNQSCGTTSEPRNGNSCLIVSEDLAFFIPIVKGDSAILLLIFSKHFLKGAFSCLGF